MKKTFTLMTALTAVQLMAVDFDFSTEPPAAKG